jgi:hypothetical protein
MSDDEPNIEWRGRVDFAEFAEALGIPSDLVMAVTPRQHGGVQAFVVLYTRPDDRGKPPEVWAQVLTRDADGVFERRGEPEVVPDFLADVERAAKGKMTRRFGPPRK